MNAFESRHGRVHGDGVPFTPILVVPGPPPGMPSARASGRRLAKEV